MSRGSVQTARVDLDSIADGVVALTDGEYRAVLEVTGSSNALDDDARQEAALAGYAAFAAIGGLAVVLLASTIAGLVQGAVHAP